MERHFSETCIHGPTDFPLIVCLCGSTKFKDEFLDLNMTLTLEGKIVVSVGTFMHADNLLLEADKRRLDLLHLRKIDLADEVLIINVRGYIGKSTARELAYAIYRHKRVVFLEPDLGEKFQEVNSHYLGALVGSFMGSTLDYLPELSHPIIQVEQSFESCPINEPICTCHYFNSELIDRKPDCPVH